MKLKSRSRTRWKTSRELGSLGFCSSQWVYHRVSRETMGGWRQWTGSEEQRANGVGRQKCNGEEIAVNQ